MIIHKSLSFILTNYSRIIYPLIKMISKDESIRGKNLDYEKRKKKNLAHPSISRQEQRMNRGIIQGARSIPIP